MSKFSSFVRLMRPINCIMMGFAVIVGGLLASPYVQNDLWLNLAYGLVTGFTLTAASMAINDYYDRDIDAINEPKRPIPSGAVKPREALVFAFILTVIGFAAAYLTNLYCLVLAVLAWVVTLTYTVVGKRSGLPGNFLVSMIVAVPIIYGSYALAETIALNVLVFAFMAFLAMTGREITKGIVDVEGDKVRNVKTLAVRFGDKAAAVVAAGFYVLAVLLSPLPLSMNLVSVWFVPLVAVTDFGLIASSFMLLKDYSRANAKKIKNMVLLWSLIGLLAFVVGAVT